MPAAGSEHKPVWRSPRLQEKYKQKGQVDYLPTVSQPDPTETLEAVPPTSDAHIVTKYDKNKFKNPLKQKTILIERAKCKTS